MRYTKNIFLKFSVSLFILIFALSAFGASKSSIKSKEYKLLLKPSFFKSPSKDYHKFWALITKVAKAQGIDVKNKEKLYDTRMIIFLDTKEFSVNKKAFILRVRADGVETTDGLITGTNGAELTLKYRSTDLASSIVAPVFGAQGLDVEVSMEEDKSIKLGQMTSVFSKSGKVFSPKFIPRTVKEICQYYPGFNKATLNPKDKLEIVNNIFIVEKRIRPGYIYLGGEKVKTLFSIWYKEGAEEPFIAEFSFKIEASRKSKKKGQLRSFPVEKAANKFFLQLAKKGEHYLNSKQTKTGLVYSQVK